MIFKKLQLIENGDQKIKKNEKIYFRKSNFVIEFIKYDRYFWFYIIKRIFSFILDILLFLLLQFILYFIFKMSIIYSSLISIFSSLLFNLSTMLVLKNRTIGMLLAGLKIGFKDGSSASKGLIVNRALYFTIFSIPFFGWILILIEIFSIILNRTLGIIDVFSKTQVFSNGFYNRMQKIYLHINKN